MELLKRIWAVPALRSRRQVGERTAQVVARVIFDLGVDTMVQGSFGLDRDCRPHFSSAVIHPERGGIALALDGLPECAALAAAVRAGCDAGELRARRAAVIAALLHEFHVRSPAFRALPASVACATAAPAEAGPAGVWSFE